jgi:hypothetical protein
MVGSDQWTRIVVLKDDATYPPRMLDQYKKKRLMKFAFCNLLIPKGMFSVVREGSEPKGSPKNEKREQGPRSPNRVFSKLYCTKGITKVKGELW